MHFDLFCLDTDLKKNSIMNAVTHIRTGIGAFNFMVLFQMYLPLS